MTEESRRLARSDSMAGHGWRAAGRAVLLNAPWLAFLLYCRLRLGENRYVSYRLPILGELPSGVYTDVGAFLLAVLLWLVARHTRATRVLYRVVAIPIAVGVLLFRLVDFYYYTSTHVPLNVYVLYGNASMVQEGLGIVRDAPWTLVFAAIVGVHFLLRLLVRRYAAMLTALADRASSPRVLMPIAVAAGLVAALDLHAVIVHPRRSAAIKSLTSEYQFVAGLPGFLAEARAKEDVPIARPARLYLPDAPVISDATGVGAGAAARRRPDVFIITVESFNALYAAPARDLNPALTEDVMPFFRSLDSAGFQFTNAYTSSAYTFNGIVSVLCSQYTISETVWGHDCLPEVLHRDGYDAFSFIAISQLRPYRYDNFRAMGFDRGKVFDAIGMRHGKKNVFFSFMLDRELFDYAASVVDSSAHASPRRPIFAHLSTNQMHVPGYFALTTCKPYPFPPGLDVDRQTRSMLNSARCTDRDLRDFRGHLQRSGLYDESLIVITADHAFNIKFWTHAESELARVPLFIKLPKSDRTVRRVDTAQLAAHIDIAPTIEEYLGLGTTRPMYGRSLLRERDVARENVAGISSSRLLSIATPRGVTFHVAGQRDSTERVLRDEMESLFATVRYFDQRPGDFEQVARTSDRSARRSVTPPDEAPSDGRRQLAQHHR
jgi:phosphoglycerol transferase MdoB-like AlkP superfamily enzyme